MGVNDVKSREQRKATWDCVTWIRQILKYLSERNIRREITEKFNFKKAKTGFYTFNSLHYLEGLNIPNFIT